MIVEVNERVLISALGVSVSSLLSSLSSQVQYHLQAVIVLNGRSASSIRLRICVNLVLFSTQSTQRGIAVAWKCHTAFLEI